MRFRKALLIGIGLFLVAVLAELVFLLWLNAGHFAYTLDDAYIHLALSENIQKGHYGINANEFSSPSSSILWPFILAPLSSTDFDKYFPFLINLLSAIGTVYFFWKILVRTLQIDDCRSKSIVITSFLVLLVLATNTAGLVFTGMEHSLQLLLAVIILWGMISEIETKKASPWLVITIVAAPLVRYENLAVSLAAILYLFVRRHRALATLSAAAVILLVGGFSVFLVKLGLEPFPASVIMKSSAIASGGDAWILLGNVKHSLGCTRGILLFCGALCLISFVFFSKQRDGKRLLAGVISISVLLHLFVGNYGWYYRYEVYIWSVAVLTLLYLSGETITGYLRNHPGNPGLTGIVVCAGLTVLVTCGPYIYGFSTLPFASNNVYEQHYQMNRFAVDYYDKPVAVNDLGYVSYGNDNYVLDLNGLASRRARHHRTTDIDPEWMNALAEAHNVEFAMIYTSDRWFPTVPENWKKVGDLHLGNRTVTAGSRSVTFYAMNEHTFKESLEVIRDFRETLPDGVEFVFER